MKDEQVGILLKAVRGVLADDELTKAEREDVLRETFDDYATSHRAGRSEGHRQHSGGYRRAGSNQGGHASRPRDDHL